MYGPDVSYAYQKMQEELESALMKLGRIKKTQTYKDRWGERNSWTYQVRNSGELVAEVDFGMGDGVRVKKGTLPDKVRQYFTGDFDKNFRKHEKNFKW